MANPLVFTTLVTPDYQTVLIRDADSDGWMDPGIERRAGAYGDDYRVALRTLQDVVPVRVDVMVRDGEPDENSGGWDGESRLRLICETGLLLFDGTFTQGLPDSWQLPGPGVYDVRVCWRRRVEAERLVQETYIQAAQEELEPEQRRALLRRLAGVEEYRVDLWPSGESLPDTDEDDIDDDTDVGGAGAER